MKLSMSKIRVVAMLLLMVGALSEVAFGLGNLNVTDNSVNVDAENKNINTDINTNKVETDINNKVETDINNGQTIAPNQEINIKTNVRIPSELMRLPGFMTIPGDDVKTWSENAKVIEKDTWTPSELANFATTRFFWIGWHEWRGKITVEVACWNKGKSTNSVRIVEVENLESVNLDEYELVGRGKGRAENFFKDTDQVAAAVAFKASKVGVDLIVVSKFSTAVATGDSAVLGGGGVTSKGDVLNMSGGFGKASSEKLMRARAVANLYRLIPQDKPAPATSTSLEVEIEVEVEEVNAVE